MKGVATEIPNYKFVSIFEIVLFQGEYGPSYVSKPTYVLDDRVYMRVTLILSSFELVIAVACL